MENGLYEEAICFSSLTLRASKIKEIEKNQLIIKGDITSNYPLFFCYLNFQLIRLIKDECLDFDIMSNKNIIIFSKKYIEIFDYKKFKIISKINIPTDLEIMSACLYNDKTILFGCKNEIFIEFNLDDNNELIEIDRKNFKCHFNHYISQILKLKNGSIVVIGDTEVYILKPDKN